jgi:nicotinate-nucleotide adenylyltransferase
MSRPRRVGILGGTFDPIHIGHMAVGEAARAALGLTEVLVVPAHDPPHRAVEPRASAFHRFAMAALAIADAPGMVLSDIELLADGPSFTATTMRRLHGLGFAPIELFFITGSDAFAEIASWRDYPALLDFCHFVAISRPAWPLAALRARLPDLAPRMRLLEAAGPAGADPVPASELSIFLVEHRTPDVSSTEIRDRVRDGHLIAGLVPPAVEHHIRRHGLYRDPGPTPAVSR